MPLIPRVLSLWRNLVHRARVERDLDDEVRAAFDLLVEEKTRAGMRPEAARRAATLELGRVEILKEQVRDVRAGAFADAFLRDVRFGARLLRRNPLFALTAAFSLAIGIGANTAVFSVVDAILLRPMDLPHPEELAVIWKGPLRGEPESGIAPANSLELRERARTAASIAPFANTEFVFQHGSDGEHVSAMRVAWNFFSMLGVTPTLGRDFVPSDDAWGAERVALLSHSLWQRRFGDDPSIIGRSIVLNGDPYLVVGVMPRGFRFPELFGTTFHPEIWTPLRISPKEAAARGSGYVFNLMRRQSQASWQSVQEELDTVSRDFAGLEPRAYTEHHLKALPIHEQVVGDVRTTLLVLWAAVTCVLLAACTNVAHILLSRATGRSRELAIRTSLGATRSRLVRQLLAESLVLGLAGAALGFVLAAIAMRVSSARGMLDVLPRAQEIAIDMRLLLFATCAGLATSALCSAMPALQLSRVAPQSAMQQAAHSIAGGRPSSRGPALLVIGQIAVALVLAVGAGLLIRSFAAVQRVDLGFRPEGVLTFDISLPTGYTPEAATIFFDQLKERLEALPEVSSAGAMSLLPLSGRDFSWTYLVRDRPLPPGEPLPRADVRMATEGALEALRVPVRRGRSFLHTDDRGAQPVAIVNETLARHSWPGGDPLGRQVKLEGPLEALPWMTVVGVAADVRFGAPDREPPPAIYRPHGQHSRREMTVVLRTTGNARDVLAAVREQMRSLDPNVAPLQFREFTYYLSRSVAQRRLFMALMSVFAALTLALALTGVYAVLAYHVSLRVREIGIRLALGARRSTVVWMVIRPALGTALLGIACGLAASVIMGRALSRHLFSVAATDPLTLGVVTLCVLGTALLASYLPARRAATVDPTVALRMD